MRFFRRFFSRFGSEQVSPPSSALDRAAEDLVERARLGEQNATAQIVTLGQHYRAGRGGGRVKESYARVLAYMHRNPPRFRAGEDIAMPTPELMASESPVTPALSQEARGALSAVSAFGCDGALTRGAVRAIMSLPDIGGLAGAPAAVVLLAEPGVLSSTAFGQCCASFGAEEAREIRYAADHPHEPPRSRAGLAGFVMGRAARLAAVRRGGKLGLLSPVMAWELGEVA